MFWSLPSAVWIVSTRRFSSSSSSFDGIDDVNKTLFSIKWVSTIPLRFAPDEFVSEWLLVRVSLPPVDDGFWSCSWESVRSLTLKFGFVRNELRRVIEPLRLNERLNESLKRKARNLFVQRFRLSTFFVRTLDWRILSMLYEIVERDKLLDRVQLATEVDPRATNLNEFQNFFRLF